MTSGRNSLVILLAVAALAAGRATAVLNCDCGTCASGEMAPETCCGEAPAEPVPCACSHLESPDALPAAVDGAESPSSIEVAIPEIAIPDPGDAVVAVTPRGPGPPRFRGPLFLRDLDLRL